MVGERFNNPTGKFCYKVTKGHAANSLLQEKKPLPTFITKSESKSENRRHEQTYLAEMRAAHYTTRTACVETAGQSKLFCA